MLSISFAAVVSWVRFNGLDAKDDHDALVEGSMVAWGDAVVTPGRKI